MVASCLPGEASLEGQSLVECVLSYGFPSRERERDVVLLWLYALVGIGVDDQQGHVKGVG